MSFDGIFSSPGCCSTSTSNTTSTNTSGIFGTPTSTALFTIIILVVIVLAGSGRIFGGYGTYPGYGGFSEFGYTYPRSRKRYRYNPYDKDDIYDD